MGVMGETIAAMFRALVLTLCVLSAAASTSFEDQVSPDTIIPQDEEVFSFVEIEQETMMGSGAGVEDVCVDQTNSDGTDWHDADGEYYDCAWYGSYESYCEWYGDHYARWMVSPPAKLAAHVVVVRPQMSCFSRPRQLLRAQSWSSHLCSKQLSAISCHDLIAEEWAFQLHKRFSESRLSGATQTITPDDSQWSVLFRLSPLSRSFRYNSRFLG